MREWDTNWDPYEQLLICSNNIQQLAAAYNSQQDTIQQLVQQNNRLTQIADRHRKELTDLRLQLDLVKVELYTKNS
jgi:ABC-type transporter Mla subunit MlaD